MHVSARSIRFRIGSRGFRRVQIHFATISLVGSSRPYLVQIGVVETLVDRRDGRLHVDEVRDPLEAGVQGLRLNPGNIRNEEHIKTVAREAKDRGISIRVGVNAGSPDKDLLEQHGGLRLWAFSTRGVKRHVDAAFADGDALLFGPESRGLPAEMLQGIGEDHTLRLPMQEGSRSLAIDTGFIVFNDRTYPNFIQLLDEIGQPSQPSEMSFSVHAADGRLEYNGSSLDGLFAQRSNLLRPSFYSMVRDILRFNRDALDEIARSPSDLTLGEYLEAGR